jgi:hypothetical protein
MDFVPEILLATLQISFWEQQERFMQFSMSDVGHYAGKYGTKFSITLIF